MARSLVLANGELAVSLNSYGLIEDFLYPYIGHHNHTYDSEHRIGVWVDEEISWIDSPDWSHKLRYYDGCAVGHMVASNDKIGVLLEFEDFVGSDRSIFGRNIHIVNLRDRQRGIRLFMHQAFNIDGNLAPDLATITADHHAVIHYSGRRAFVASGMTDIGQAFDQYSVGLFGDGLDGTWRDAEDGELSECGFAEGNTDSTLGFSLTIGGLSSRRVYYWVSAGTSIKSALALSEDTRQKGLTHQLSTTVSWWRRWLTPGNRMAERILPKYRNQFLHSLVWLRTQIDSHGAVVPILHLRVNHCAPVEAAYVVWPLIRLGYKNEVLAYFNFLKQSISRDGWLANSYRADGATGKLNSPFPSPDVIDTATTLFMLTQALPLIRTSRSYPELYDSLLAPMADYLSSSPFVNDITSSESIHGEPVAFEVGGIIPSASVVVSALSNAADMADSLKRQTDAVRWRNASDDVREVMASQLSSDNMENIVSDITSFYSVFMFGILDSAQHEMKASLRSIEKRLLRSDGLFAASEDKQDIDYIGSLRMAQYYLEVGEDDMASTIIELTISRINNLQFDVSQPALLNAELVSTLLDTIVLKK